MGKSEDNAIGEEESGEKVKNNKNTISASPTTDKARENILGLMDSFIEQITTIRKILLGVSISALLLAPLAIGPRIFDLHPSFFAILEIENEFGLVLSILLGAVLIISSIWLVSGIRQYKSIRCV